MSIMMRKDPSMIGRLSNKKLDVSNCLFKDSYEKNNSIFLPLLQGQDERVQIFDKSTKQIRQTVQKMDRSSQVDDWSESPLPQIKVSFSKIQQLNRVCRKNPEEATSQARYPRNMNGKRTTALINIKKDHLIGHLYSPREHSIAETNKYSEIRPKSRKQQSKKNNFKNFLENQYIQQIQKKQKQNFTVIEYNRRFSDSMSSSVYLKSKEQKILIQNEHLKEQSTQSRVIPIEPVGIDSGSELQKSVIAYVKGQISLRNEGEKGYFQSKKEQIKKQQNSDLKFLWEQNFLQPQQKQSIKSVFYKQELDKNEQVIQISFKKTISQIKSLLIQQVGIMKISFSFSETLLQNLSQTVTQPQVHMHAQKIFSTFLPNFKPQLISLKKFINCILVTTKPLKQHNNILKSNKIAILWYFTGRFYVGGWRVQQNQNEGYKCGVGIEFYPQHFIYYGNFQRNARSGIGLMKKASREVYLGEWMNNKRQGWGKVFDQTGSLVYDGDFEGGRFKQSRIHAKQM